MKRPIYLDNHATTAVDPRVIEAMLPYFGERYGNAGSRSHSYGWEAEAAVKKAREQVASLLGTTPETIVFTAGATESTALALLGWLRPLGPSGKRIVTCTIEHPATLDTCDQLAAEGAEILRLSVDEHGCLSLDELEQTLRDGADFVTLMLANNEIGTLIPLAEIAQLCRDTGVPFHLDAAQALGKIPIDLRETPVDFLSLSAHKFYGPKGVGALHVSPDLPRRPGIQPLIAGGGQEGGLRPGTTNVPGLVGLGEASALCEAELAAGDDHVGVLRDDLQRRLAEAVDGFAVNGHPELRLPGNLSARFEGVEAEALILAMPSLALSAGSACSSGSGHASHVLLGIGLSEAQARSTLRFGLGRFNTAEEIDAVVEQVVAAVASVRG
ncbi:MAG: cysteine desulfurase family protein [Acidobacteriota bacterium]